MRKSGETTSGVALNRLTEVIMPRKERKYASGGHRSGFSGSKAWSIYIQITRDNRITIGTNGR